MRIAPNPLQTSQEILIHLRSTLTFPQLRSVVMHLTKPETPQCSRTRVAIISLKKPFFQIEKDHRETFGNYL